MHLNCCRRYITKQKLKQWYTDVAFVWTKHDNKVASISATEKFLKTYKSTEIIHNISAIEDHQITLSNEQNYAFDIRKNQ